MKPEFLKTETSGFWGRLSRRDLFKGTGLAALAGMFGCAGRGMLKKAPVPYSPRIPIPTVQSIGVKPAINCWGTYTHHSGSLMEPEVKMAMEEASKQFVLMDELMEAVGRRLAELTGAEWGAVFSGCAAAMTGATCACVAGADPEKMLLLPHTEGMKDEVICKNFGTYSRAIWMVGVKMILAKTKKEMEAAINDRTAMMFAYTDNEDIIEVGKKHGIPILVDVAAEEPNVPIIHLKRGADLVAYSGGKCLRGPQDSGLLLGRKDLVQAAFLNMAPHHAFGRPMKISKEGIMGALAALDLWINGRDHDAEWKEWERRLDYIIKNISQIPTISTTVNQPRGLSNHAPSLSITWDQSVVKILPLEVQKQLLNQNPRISVPIRGNGISIQPYQTQPGDEILIANGINKVFSGVV